MADFSITANPEVHTSVDTSDNLVTVPFITPYDDILVTIFVLSGSFFFNTNGAAPDGVSFGVGEKCTITIGRNNLRCQAAGIGNTFRIEK